MQPGGRTFHQPQASTPVGVQWTAVAKLLHWLVAALIALQFVLGWMAATWRLSPTKLELFVWHKSTGMLVLLLVLVRLGWRLTHPAPELPAGMPRWERIGAQLSHVLLYAAMLALPLTGWVINSAAGVPFRIYWHIPLPALVAPDRHVAGIAAAVHFAIGMALLLLLVVHVGAALRHHFVKRDDVLSRMLPKGRKKAP